MTRAMATASNIYAPRHCRIAAIESCRLRADGRRRIDYYEMMHRMLGFARLRAGHIGADLRLM